MRDLTRPEKIGLATLVATIIALVPAFWQVQQNRLKEDQSEIDSHQADESAKIQKGDLTTKDLDQEPSIEEPERTGSSPPESVNPRTQPPEWASPNAQTPSQEPTTLPFSIADQPLDIFDHSDPLDGSTHPSEEEGSALQEGGFALADFRNREISIELKERVKRID